MEIMKTSPGRRLKSKNTAARKYRTNLGIWHISSYTRPKVLNRTTLFSERFRAFSGASKLFRFVSKTDSGTTRVRSLFYFTTTLPGALCARYVIITNTKWLVISKVISSWYLQQWCTYTIWPLIYGILLPN